MTQHSCSNKNTVIDASRHFKKCKYAASFSYKSPVWVTPQLYLKFRSDIVIVTLRGEWRGLCHMSANKCNCQPMDIKEMEDHLVKDKMSFRAGSYRSADVWIGWSDLEKTNCLLISMVSFLSILLQKTWKKSCYQTSHQLEKADDPFRQESPSEQQRYLEHWGWPVRSS